MGGEKALKCLSNSVSRFIHLVTSVAPKNMPCQNEYKDVADSLKLFKRIIDTIDDSQIKPDETLCNECEELDLAVNEARELIESWGSQMSKIFVAVQSRHVTVKIQTYSIKICQTVCGLLDSSSALIIPDIEHCMQDFQSLKMGNTSEKIETALKFIKEGKIQPLEHIIEIVEFLNLSSCHELLKESIVVEKENMKVNQPDRFNLFNNIGNLVYHIRETLVNLESFKAINGVTVPSHFICPLSLDLMLDPVITASGQTYERDSIQTWLNHGLTKCPVTLQELSHTNLITNYTVKALISSWCDKNNINILKTDHPDESEDSEKSPEESSSHSRSESSSTAVSSSDYLSGEMGSGVSPWPPGKQYQSSKSMSEMIINGGNNGNQSYPRTVSLPLDSSSNDLTTVSHITHLVCDLNSSSNEAQTKAAEEIRFLAKNNMENRIIIGESGAILPLLSLLHSPTKLTQEHAVTALLNLSINTNIKSTIAKSGAIDPLIHVLQTGNTCAKENSAAALFSLSILEEYRVKIGRSRAVKPLVDLLGSGTLRGKKDAATALFNLSIFHENKVRIIQAGAVKYLVGLMDDQEMVDKAVALLSNLSTVSEGCLAIAREGGIPLLVETVETGTQRGKENAASVLLQLCLSSTKYCRLVLQEGAVPPLVALSQSGTARAKEKAQQLLSHFRNQREKANGRGKS